MPRSISSKRVGRPAKTAKVASTPRSHVRHRRIHGHLVSLFGIAAALLVMLNAAVLLVPPSNVSASSSDNVTGWAWSDTGGWLSMNDINSGAGGGTYGVHVNPSTRVVDGFAWSPNQGWICFGSSCAVAGCANGANTPAGSAPAASVDTSTPNRLRGWGMACNLSGDGWISLNCLDTGVAGSCGAGNYGPTVNFGTGAFSGFAWHGVSNNTGWGWIDFSGVQMSSNSEGSLPTCQDGLDNDLDGDVDCEDNGCFQNPAYNCPAIETQCVLLGRVNCCANGTDDDNDGLIDCDDVADCGSAPACVPEVCDNEIDDDGDGDIDCSDSDCDGFAACTPAWIRSQHGNIYAQEGVSGNAPPPGEANATYCISSAGAITNFTSAEGCIESSATALNLPTGGNGYVSSIGRLDVEGILSGRYGEVENIVSDAGIDPILGGKVYLYDRDAQGGCPSGSDFVLGPRTFSNAAGVSGRGNGLLVVKGCDIRISGDLEYQPTGVSQYLRNLASMGVLSLTRYVGGVPTTGGNISVDPSVSQIVGLYFAEQSIFTGSTGVPETDIQLNVYGGLVGRQIRLERRYSSVTEPAENIIFDGRGVVNPPPGLQDVTKSLPSLRDAF